MRIKRNNFRMKSQAVQLDYVSPWKAPPQSGRNALQILLTKSKILEEVTQGKEILSDNKNLVIVERSKTSSPKKTARTDKKEDKYSLRKSYLQNYLSQSEPLRKESGIKKVKQNQQAIFMKKNKHYHKAKLITVGNQHMDEQPQDKQIEVNSYWKQKQYHSNQSNPYLSNSKRKFLVKRQRQSYNNSRQDIQSHKGFVYSLQNCLNKMQRTNYQQQTTKQLTKTLKNLLCTYKNI